MTSSKTNIISFDDEVIEIINEDTSKIIEEVTKRPRGRPATGRREYYVSSGKPVGRPRFNPEISNRKPNDPDYFKKYWLNKMKPIKLEARIEKLVKQLSIMKGINEPETNEEELEKVD